MRAATTHALVAGSIFLLVTGCQTSATPHANSTHLMQVHDPKRVTYSRTLTARQCRTSTNAGQPLPDPTCTPGAVDPNATVAQLCRAGGYTTSVRPPVSGTSGTGKAKNYAYQAYGIATGTVSELDHLVPLSVGGANDITNLWPEVGSLPNPKDRVETVIHNALCTHAVDLAAAQQAIAANWTTALSVLHLGTASLGDPVSGE